MVLKHCISVQAPAFARVEPSWGSFLIAADNLAHPPTRSSMPHSTHRHPICARKQSSRVLRDYAGHVFTASRLAAGVASGRTSATYTRHVKHPARCHAETNHDHTRYSSRALPASESLDRAALAKQQKYGHVASTELCLQSGSQSRKSPSCDWLRSFFVVPV